MYGVGKRALIILHRFTRPRFDDAMVVRSNDWAFTRQVDFGDVLGPCCLRGEGVTIQVDFGSVGVTSHGEKGNVNEVVDARVNMYEEYSTKSIYTVPALRRIIRWN